MPVVTFRVMAFFVILVTGVVGGLTARRIAGSKRSEFLFSMGNAFAGGVFLGAGLIHMLPDAQEGFRALTNGSDYPWFALVCCVGFLAILLLEKVLMRHDHNSEPFHGGPVFPYVLMLALSIHSIITGIALGTESKIAQAVVIMIAVVAHKGTAAFALGVSMTRAQVALRRFFVMILLFAFMTPFGLLLGCGFMKLLAGTAEQVFEALFDALAAGTFLYIALLDIVQEEFSRERHNALKFLLVLSGLAVMAIVAVWT